jgi:hypothetical protein
MLQRLETDHDIDRPILEGDRQTGPYFEPKILRTVAGGGMCDDRRVNVDPDDAPSASRQHRGAVTLTTGDVQYVETVAKASRDKISMKVLKLELGPDTGHVSLPVERHSAAARVERNQFILGCPRFD